jgi:membrane protein DedA with SNARE-associated domain
MTLDPANWPGGLAYAIVFLAALLEGEIVFVAAAALVGQGALNGAGVIAAGTLGAAAGDQLAFYLLRARLRTWLDRAAVARRAGRALERAVRKHGAWLSFAVRFAPGLRLTIVAACAYAAVPGWVFSLANLAGALVWAVGILWLVARVGPQWLQRLGLHDWWAVVPPVVIVLGLVWYGSRLGRKLAAEEAAAEPEA